MMLTGEEGLAAIARLQYGGDVDPEDQGTLNIVELCNRLRDAAVREGRQISPFPAVCREIGPHVWDEVVL
jgi:hypothetical protein